MTSKTVVVIGGGAAGMMSGIFASYNGDNVIILEKNQKVGRKLYITGKGRCNVTNNCDIETVIANTPTNARFLYSALNRFSPLDTIDFFEMNGVPLKTERGNRVFPVSDKAGDIVDALFRICKQSGCKIINEPAIDIIIENNIVTAVKTKSRIIKCDKVIVACGGKSYPLTGSTGDGYKFAQKAGHHITELKPSLVPLETSDKFCSEMNGLQLKNIAVTVIDTTDRKKIYNDFGELLFTYYGVSGPVILSASSHLKNMSPDRYKISIDLKPALSEEQLDARLIREFTKNHTKEYIDILHSLLPAKMINVFTRISEIPSHKKCSEITKTERYNIIKLLKNFELLVKAFRPIEEAIVTSGGVDIKEINPKTMQSKLVSGLYFAGEVIDVDCYTGGFNLQTAFSTGVLAGEN